MVQPEDPPGSNLLEDVENAEIVPGAAFEAAVGVTEAESMARHLGAA